MSQEEVSALEAELIDLDQLVQLNEQVIDGLRRVNATRQTCLAVNSAESAGFRIKEARREVAGKLMVGKNSNPENLH